MILISNDFWHKRKMYNFYTFNVLLAISTNIPALLFLCPRVTYFKISQCKFLSVHLFTYKAQILTQRLLYCTEESQIEKEIIH